MFHLLHRLAAAVGKIGVLGVDVDDVEHCHGWGIAMMFIEVGGSAFSERYLF